MASNASRGQYYKGRTKEWLESTGWTVGFMERVNWIVRPGARPLPVKQDQFGADLIGVNDAAIVFVQSKFYGTDDRRNAHQLKLAAELFRRYPCPPGAKQWIAIWTKGAKAPRIVEVTRDATGVELPVSSEPPLPFGRARPVPVSRRASTSTGAEELCDQPRFPRLKG